MKTTVFLMLRLGIALSMLGHGLVRLPKLHDFSMWMVGSFEHSFIPTVVVLPFSYMLPFLEFGIGLLLVLGLFTRPVLMAGAVVVFILILGTCLIENWEAIPSQLIHLSFFAVLYQFSAANTYALDRIIHQTK